MARTVRRRAGLRLVVVAGILGILNGVLPAAPAVAATDKLPDLRVARIGDFSIQRTASGRRLLRFSGMMLNVGRGPFEIRGRRASTKKPWIIDQVIYRTGGTKRRVPTTATMRYAGDGHDHWHVRRILSYHLWSTRGHQSRREDRFLLLRYEPTQCQPARRPQAAQVLPVGLRQTTLVAHDERHLRRMG